MIAPPQNQLVFAGFNYSVADGEKKSPNGESEPLKSLTFQEHLSGLALTFCFTQAQFDKFQEVISGSRIVRASKIIL